MKNILLRFACYLTGYRYSILMHSSAASAKYVRKTLSAFIIICTLWAYIGYTFGSLYFGLNVLESSMLSFVLVVLVVQIERQITLSTNSLGGVGWVRTFIGITMAIIGSIATDQILFQGDIEKNRINLVTPEVINSDSRIVSLDKKIEQIDNSIKQLNGINVSLFTQYSENPKIDGEMSTIVTFDTLGNPKKSTIRIPKEDNPVRILIDSSNSQLTRENNRRYQLLIERDTLSEHVRLEKISLFGPLDDLNVLIYTFGENHWSFVFWLCFFLLFLFLEMLVLFNKRDEKHTDYYSIIQHQIMIKRKLLNQEDEKLET